MKKGKKNRVLKAICILAVLVIAIGLIQFVRYKYVAKCKIELIDSSVSADGNYELLFQSVGEPEWPFGPTHARFILKNNGRDVSECKFDVANDGKTLCADNWRVTWTNSSAEVIISGEEQQDMLYSLSFDGDVKIRTASDNAAYTYYVAYANWTENSGIYKRSMNGEKMIISSVQHLPVYKFDTKADLDAFKAFFKDVLTMDQGLDETPSFEYITAGYDDSFFSKYLLMLAYVPASSGSFRFGVGDVYCDGQSFCMYVEQLNDPEAYDAMMAGWFAVVEVDKKDIENCVDFDAQLSHASAGVGISDTNNIRKDVCELYLTVLEDLWNVDPGLNDKIAQIGIDLSELSHLTEGEKETVMKEFAAKHNLLYIEGTWEELCERGYIDKENLYWEDGLFFSIKTNEDALKADSEGLEYTSFDAQKWRSGLGAYFFGQCLAQKNTDGTWSYTVGQEAIS